MKSILEKLKLTDHLTTELVIDKQDFVKRFISNIDQGDTGVFFSAFEVFSSSNNQYKGTVSFDTFKIRRRRRFFDMNTSLAIAEGKFTQKENVLVIESTISGFRGVFIPFIVFLVFFYVVFIISFIVSDAPGNKGWFIIPFLFHAALMLGIPYLMMRRGVSRLKYELERDLYYMTK